MTLDPAMAALLDQLRERGEPAMFQGVFDGVLDGDGDSGVEEARHRFADGLRETVRPSPRLPEVVDGPDTPDGPVPLRLHRPEGGPTSDATVVFVHGGGWALGGGAAYDPVAARVAEDTGALVVAVDYRLAPERPFPDPYDDVVAALRWVLDRWGVDPARCALVGDSAGAHLAMGAAAALSEDGVRLAAQVLVYPPVDFETRLPSLAENGEGYWLTARDIKACSRLYLGGRDPRDDVRLAPARSSSLAGLAPTVIATAGFDPLRDAGAALAAALTAAGADARVLEHPGLAHGFLGFTAVVPAADAAVAALNAELGSLLGPGGAS